VQDGKKRKLRVANISSKDEGFYKCKVQDKVTSAKLYVAREYSRLDASVMPVFSGGATAVGAVATAVAIGHLWIWP